MTVVYIFWLKLLKNLYQSTARVATSLSVALRRVCSSETYRSTCPARGYLAAAAAAAVVVMVVVVVFITASNKQRKTGYTGILYTGLPCLMM